MNVQQATKRRKRSPLGPLIGFIVLVVVLGVSFLAAPSAVNWLETAEFTLGAFGWRVLPITFPAEWSPLVIQTVVTLFMALVLFIILMIIMFALMKPPREELDVEYSAVRARKGATKRQGRRR